MLAINSFLVYQLAAFLGAIGQALYKKGTDYKPHKSNLPAYINIFIITGVLVYWLVIILFIFAYSLGGALSVLYPTYGMTFIYSLIIACFFYKEKISFLKICGILLIAGGIILVTV